MLSVSWADRDMFMRYLGGGIGHQNQDARWTSSNRYEDDAIDMEVDPPCEEDIDDDPKKLQGLQELAKELATRPVGEDDKDLDTDDSDSDGSLDDDDASDEDEASDEDDLFPDGREEEDSDLGPCDGEDEDGDDADFGSF